MDRWYFVSILGGFNSTPRGFLSSPLGCCRGLDVNAWLVHGDDFGVCQRCVGVVASGLGVWSMQNFFLKVANRNAFPIW